MALTRYEDSLDHERIVSGIMVLLVIALGLVLCKRLIEGEMGLRIIIISLGIIVGIIGMMIIISIFFEDAPALPDNSF
jgi:hypothetical protein